MGATTLEKPSFFIWSKTLKKHYCPDHNIKNKLDQNPEHKDFVFGCAKTYETLDEARIDIKKIDENLKPVIRRYGTSYNEL